MTTCVAAICQEGIIVVSDERISVGSMSGNILSKCDFILSSEWVLMFAGDVSQATILHSKIDQHKNVTDDLESVVNVCRSSYWELVSEEAAASVLGPLNLTLDKFLDEGQSRFPESVFNRLVGDMQNHQRDREPCILLIAGFGTGAHIFVVYTPSTIHYADRIGFAAIGTGAEAVLADLYFHEYKTSLSYHEAMYRVLSAKFMSERASDVGDTTLAMLIRRNDSPITLEDDQVGAVRKMWEEEGCARLPEDYENRMDQIFKTSEYFASPSEPEPPV